MNTLISFIVDFFQENSVKIIIIVILFLVAKFILARIVKRIIKLFDDKDQESRSRLEKRADTLGSVCLAIGNAVIYTIILFMILSLFEVDIRPVLAGAGIIGLAIGFGAQSLVKDFVSGLFVLIEDQYNVGDRIKIGVSEGRVEALTLRSTVLKDEEGKIYYIQNGSISNVVNLSKKKT